MNLLREMCTQLPMAPEHINNDDDFGFASSILFSIASAGVSIQRAACRAIGVVISLEPPVTTTTTAEPPNPVWVWSVWTSTRVGSLFIATFRLSCSLLWSAVDALATMLWGPSWVTFKFYTSVVTLILVILVLVWGLNV